MSLAFSTTTTSNAVTLIVTSYLSRFFRFAFVYSIKKKAWFAGYLGITIPAATIVEVSFGIKSQKHLNR